VKGVAAGLGLPREAPVVVLKVLVFIVVQNVFFY
jgi:hypothetical protein